MQFQVLDCFWCSGALHDQVLAIGSFRKEGVIGKRHGDAHDGDVVISFYLCCLRRHESFRFCAMVISVAYAPVGYRGFAVGTPYANNQNSHHPS